jgi:predicted RNA binding protein YcfA (HicA-like mRNA interferase family)
MPKLTPTDWRTLERIFEADGWMFSRTKGSHRSYTKPGYPRAVIIPSYRDIGIDIIKSNMRTAGMDNDRYFALMAKVC